MSNGYMCVCLTPSPMRYSSIVKTSPIFTCSWCNNLLHVNYFFSLCVLCVWCLELCKNCCCKNGQCSSSDYYSELAFFTGHRIVINIVIATITLKRKFLVEPVGLVPFWFTSAGFQVGITIECLLLTAQACLHDRGL